MKTFIHLFAVLALLLLFANSAEAQGYIYTKAAPSGPTWSTTSSTWVDIPDLDLWFYQEAPGNACIGLSAESYASTGKRMFVRAVIDGSPASPSDVVFTSETMITTRMFQFSATLGLGIHHVTMQVKIDGGGTANLADRTMWVITAPTLINIVAAPSGPAATTTSGLWEDVPDLSLNITMPETGPLTLAFSAEVFSTNGQRAFLRAVVDGVAGSPSDVVIANGYIFAVHGMTFTFPSVSAGSHSAKLQWSVDGGGTAYIGDRTLAIIASDPMALAAERGGAVSTSATSGPQVTTTQSSFVDIPGLSLDVPVPENATLAISLQGEAYVSGGRMAVRATIDGVPCSPSDVMFTFESTYYGTSSMTFVQRNVSRGTRHIAMQWLIDAGNTGYFGDRNVTVFALPCAGPNISSGFNDVKPVIGTIPVLALLWDPERPTDPAPSLGSVANLLHGSYPSVADYFSVNSGTIFSIANAGILGWFKADKPSSFYWSPNDPTDADGDGFVSGHVRKWWEAVTKADPTFNFQSYDTDGDGVLDPTELSVLIVIPQNGAFGTVRVPASKEYPTWQPLVVDGVRIPLIAEVYAGAPPNMGAFSHELSHLMLSLPDMYFTFFFPYAAGHYSLMDVCYIDSHLDPFHKMHLGWLQPTVVRKSGSQTIAPVESGGGIYILMDPAHGEEEYFMVENRQRGVTYDSDIADSGLAVWHIMEDADVYGTLTTPSGVQASDWSTIPAGDWGRRAIRMIRPVYGPPFDNAKALWDGSDPQTGYDLTSTDLDPSHMRLLWADGSPSGFAIRNISPATGTMTVTFEIPASATGIQSKGTLPTDFTLYQNYPNPFNPKTLIRSQLPAASHVRLVIYDLLGREVATIVDERRTAGSYEDLFDGGNLSSGIYFYRLSAGNLNLTRKMVLMK